MRGFALPIVSCLRYTFVSPGVFAGETALYTVMVKNPFFIFIGSMVTYETSE